MLQFLFMGDPHCRVTDLEEVAKVNAFALKVCNERKVDYLVILGDSYHTHGVINAEVQHLWHEFFQECHSVGQKVIVLKGNHDAPGVAGSNAHSLEVFKHLVTVVDNPLILEDILWLPYTSNEEVLAACQRFFHIQTLVCHATFTGSQYENGFYAPDGIDPAVLPQSYVISGHIHLPQDIGKVRYVGAPRALTRSDANVVRHLMLQGFQNGVAIIAPEYIPLTEVCQQLYALEDTYASPLEFDYNPRHRYFVDITGPAAWIEQRKALYAGKAKVRTFRTDKPVAKVKESEGISAAFSKFVQAYKPTYGTSKEALETMLKERRLG